MRSRAAFLGILTVMASLLGVACGDGDSPAATSVITPTGSSTSAATSVPSTVASASPTPTVEAGDLVTVGMSTFLNVPNNVAPQALWCYECHFIQDVPEAGGKIGPDLSHIGTDAATRVSGLSAEEYIRESILDPGGFICDVERCNAGLMTSAITENLTGEQVNALVAFLLTHE